jgi:hypothetical protein
MDRGHLPGFDPESSHPSALVAFLVAIGADRMRLLMATPGL